MFYERLLAAGIDVRVVRATQLRLRPAVAVGGPTRGTSTDSGTSTIARSSSSTVASPGSAARGSRTTSTTGGSTTCSSRRGPVTSQLQLVFVATFRWLGASFP